jgi:histidinol phosphatase-like enzyme
VRSWHAQQDTKLNFVASTYKHLSSIFCIMARIEELFTILCTLINSITESTIAINKCTLSTVITCLQVTHKKIDMFKHQNKLLSDELSLLRHQQCDFNNQNDIKDENNEDIQLTSDDSHKHEFAFPLNSILFQHTV